jgi:hypothetical protein
MSIEITNPETERVVRELARRLNVEPEEAVRRASEAALEGRLDDEDAAIERIVAEVKTLPVADPRPIDELLSQEEPG